MTRKYTKDEIRTLAASYALGNLGDAEKKEFEELLRDRDGSIEKELKTFRSGQYSSTMPPAGPLEGRLFAKIREKREEHR
jgi:anti-sigma-K factor RskA